MKINKSRKHLARPVIYFRAAFIPKDLLRLAIHVNNSQYLCNFCRTLLVVEDFW